LATAEALLRAALQRNRRHAKALHQLGLMAQTTGRLPLARRLLGRAVQLAPHDAVYAFNLGNLLFELRRLREAISSWRTAAGLDPALEDSYRNIGLTCMEIGEPAEAERAFRVLTELNEHDGEAARHHAAALRALGRRPEAAAASARGRSLARDTTALVKLAARRQRMGRFAHALAALERAAEIAPDDAEIHYRLGDALIDLSRERDARGAFERACRLDPGHTKAVLGLDALEGRTPPTLPAGLVAEEFDRFASVFDRHLVARLGYRGPTLVWTAVRRALQAQGRPVENLAILDIGCGTGLAAPLLRPHARSTPADETVRALPGASPGRPASPF
jgi:tetratricopeptide (TPR) repeat protein